jgi:hypothetical protein
MQPLIFMHIPKCGGTTLTSILTEAVPEDRRFSVDGRNIAGSRKELAGLSETERERIELLLGHLCYGWHELLAPRRARYFTIVREPVSRVVSHFDFVRSHENHYLHSAVVSGKMTVADYVESGITTEVNDGQVRQISGVEDIAQAPYGPSVVGYGEDHSALLEEAWTNIERDFLLVGLLERFDETLQRLRRMTGLRIGTYREKNVVRPTDASRPTPNEADVIRRYNRQDRELYNRCKEAFEHGGGPAGRFRRLLTRRS